MEYLHASSLAGRKGWEPHDVAVVGAGPVGLATAVELARMELRVLLLDRRPPISEDPKARPQVLVARPGDLANLAHMGIDIWNPTLIAPLTRMHRADFGTGNTRGCPVRFGATGSSVHEWVGTAASIDEALLRAPDLGQLVDQAPAALVPIDRLQRALLGQAHALGVEVCYRARASRIKRHARAVSIEIEGAKPVLAKLVVVATGAARALLGEHQIDNELVPHVPSGGSPSGRALIGGVLEHSGDACQWTRVEIPVSGYARGLRATALATGPEAGAGTALIVDAPPTLAASPSVLRRLFALAARELELDASAYRVEPQVFLTSVAAVRERVVAGDGRAPVVIAGDAAQTGHVFGGLTCFVNLWLALYLCEELRGATGAIAAGKLGSESLARALARYQSASKAGATLLARTSRSHLSPMEPGTWALGGHQC